MDRSLHAIITAHKINRATAKGERTSSNTRQPAVATLDDTRTCCLADTHRFRMLALSRTGMSRSSRYCGFFMLSTSCSSSARCNHVFQHSIPHYRYEAPRQAIESTRPPFKPARTDIAPSAAAVQLLAPRSQHLGPQIGVHCPLDAADSELGAHEGVDVVHAPPPRLQLYHRCPGPMEANAAPPLQRHQASKQASNDYDEQKHMEWNEPPTHTHKPAKLFNP